MKKNEWLWKFWKRNDLYENFEKGGVSREKGGGGNEIHAPCACDKDDTVYVVYFYIIDKDDTIYVVFFYIIDKDDTVYVVFFYIIDKDDTVYVVFFYIIDKDDTIYVVFFYIIESLFPLVYRKK